MRHKKDLDERIAQGLSVSPLDETPERRGSVSSSTSHPESLPEDEPGDTATMVTQPVTKTTQGIAMETTVGVTSPSIRVIEATPDRETPTPGESDRSRICCQRFIFSRCLKIQLNDFNTISHPLWQQPRHYTMTRSSLK